MTAVRLMTGLGFVAAFLVCVTMPVVFAGDSSEADSNASSPEGDSQTAWLERMSAALNQLDYQGTFVYVEGDDVQTMKITHIVDESGVRERLVSQTGAQREILRDSNGVSWVLEDDQQVMEDASFSRSYFSKFAPIRIEHVQQRYALALGKAGRIAGRKARSLEIAPLDNYRYGYVLWLELNTGLLLKWELFDENQKPLAKLMFTDIRLGNEVDADELVPARGRLEYDTVAADLPDSQSLSQTLPQWQPASLPPGFELTTHRRLNQPGSTVFEHNVYSDGFATVSVYVESAVDKGAPPTGISRLGTTHAFSRQESDVTITVIGDVPARTVELIGKAVRMQQSGN